MEKIKVEYDNIYNYISSKAEKGTSAENLQNIHYAMDF